MLTRDQVLEAVKDVPGANRLHFDAADDARACAELALEAYNAKAFTSRRMSRFTDEEVFDAIEMIRREHAERAAASSAVTSLLGTSAPSAPRTDSAGKLGAINVATIGVNPSGTRGVLRFDGAEVDFERADSATCNAAIEAAHLEMRFRNRVAWKHRDAVIEGRAQERADAFHAQQAAGVAAEQILMGIERPDCSTQALGDLADAARREMIDRRKGK
jgi:hypothetical protein